MKLLNYYNEFKTSINSRFVKGVVTFSAATILSQAFTLLCSPILARIYDPVDFGNLSIFISILSIIASVSTGLYEQAIILPKKDSTAFHIFVIGCLIAISYSVLMLFLIGFWNYFLPIKSITKNWLYLIPPIVALNSCCTMLQYWFLRKSNYLQVSYSTVTLTISNLIGSFLFGLLGYNFFGLIGGYMFSNICYVLIYFYYLKKFNYLANLNFIKKPKLISLAKKYIQFPKYQLPSNLFFIISSQIIPFILSSIFTTVILGGFTMATRIVRTPIILLSGAIGNVFRNYAMEEIHKTGNCQVVYKKVLVNLILLGILPFVLLSIFLPNFISLLFGPKWIDCGKFAQVLCLAMFFEFLEIPMRTVFIITENQKINVYLQILSTGTVILSLYLGYYFLKTPLLTITIYSIGCAFVSIISLYLSFKCSCGKMILKKTIF